MYAVALVLLVVLLAGLAPRIMAQLLVFRRAPLAALIAWQAVSLAAVIAALATAPAAVIEFTSSPWFIAVAGVLTGVVLTRLGLSGHRIGTRLREARERHRDLIDAIATPMDNPAGTAVHVLDHPTATAYCLPGRRSRVILTRGTLANLPAPQLEAVLAHERAHLRSRHDLLLEYFTVIHDAMPRPLRCPAALNEVRLLIEALADRAAAAATGPVATARALLALAAAPTPAVGLGAGGGLNSTAARMQLLSEDPLPTAMIALMYGYAAGALISPVALLWLAWMR